MHKYQSPTWRGPFTTEEEFGSQCIKDTDFITILQVTKSLYWMASVPVWELLSHTILPFLKTDLDNIGSLSKNDFWYYYYDCYCLESLILSN